MKGFNSKIFFGNRRGLCGALPDCLIIIPASSLLQESADTAYPFRQNSNFWYLTGIDEPDLVLVIDTSKNQSTLLLPKQNEYQKDWDGVQDTEEYRKISGISRFSEKLKLTEILKLGKNSGLQICYLEPPSELIQPFGFYSNPACRVLAEQIQKIEQEPKDIRLEIARLRQIKQPVELETIRRAINITGDALANIKQRLPEFKTEKDIERALSAGFFEFGADGHGFESIVASGKNAATIHYRGNSKKLASSDLVLLDVGAKVGHYSADISRTWAPPGHATERQKEVFLAVKDIQQYAFDLMKPGALLIENQKKIDIYAQKIKKQLGTEQDKIPHGVSHFLGIDVHDAGDYMLPLQENSVLTVEPGIYLPEEGIGVRIEDVVRITKTGIEIISKDIPTKL